MALAWMALFDRPKVGDALMGVVTFLGPLWVAVVFGVLVGWAWKPKWVKLAKEKFDNAKALDKASGILGPFLNLNLSNMASTLEEKKDKEPFGMAEALESDKGSSQIENKSLLVRREDLEHLCQLVEGKDGGPAWQQMMDRSMPNMSYQAWRRDPQIGPPQYRSRTVFEDATPELVRDFFYDDDFRPKWDDMLIHSETLEECPATGAMVVQWVRKFPFFCSDREYIIGRRIWDSGRTYYCVTKGVPCDSVPRRDKPRRVDLYYSSWCIRAGE